MRDEGADVRVSVIPGRDMSRSHAHWWSGGPPGSASAVHPLVIGGAFVSIAALAIAVAVGAAPFAASAAVALMVPAAVIDVERRRLPDVWAIASLTALVAALSAEAVVEAASPGATLAGIVCGALTMALPLLALHLASPDAMGFGDVKAALVLGAAIGTIDWRLGAVALCLAALTGATAGGLGRRRTIAFGPYLVFGAWTVVLAGEPIVDALFTGASQR